MSSDSFQLIRSATCLIEVDSTTFLIDPMLDPALTHEGVPRTMNPQPWPLVDLPVPAAEVVSACDAVLLTHAHVDHLDRTAVDLLIEREVPVYCQPADLAELRDRGLVRALAVNTSVRIGSVEVTRTGGSHGTGEVAEWMGPVSGWVIAGSEHSIYVAGDTVWCEAVSSSIAAHRPDVVVVNAGGARMDVGDAIIMEPHDVLNVARAGRHVVVAVHFETISHCLVSRHDMREFARREGIQVVVPEDGQRLTIAELAVQSAS